MLSLFFAVFFIAAGSNASPCKVSSKASASSSGAGVTPTGYPPGSQQLFVDAGATKPLEFAVQNSSETQLVNGPGSGAQAGIQQIGSGSTSHGACPPGFINTVFNTGAPRQQGWPTTVWSSLTSNGINDWIGFSLPTIDQKPTYNTDAGPAAVLPALNNAQIHMVMDPRDTDAAVRMVQGPSPPNYLGLFNEPDYSFEGLTPMTDPVTAAQNLQALFSIPHSATTYIAPGLAFPNAPWLATFRDNCNNCFDQIPIVSMHIYEPNPSAVISGIQTFHSTWPDKKIWITELSPARDDCALSNGASGPGSIGDYIATLIPQIIALGYVEKIFWNGGEWGATGMNAAPAPCNPSLTDANGAPTGALQALGKVCGGRGAPAGGSTATS